eukprot:tig00000841_g4726.t1
MALSGGPPQAGDPPGGAGARSPRRASAADRPAGMGKEWIPAEGKLDLGGKDREEWPAAEIAAAGPENIRWLELGENKLTRIPGAELAKLTNLEWLWLTNNRLTDLPPEIGRLAALRWLNVQSNQLTTLPSEIGRLAALQTLYVNDNQLTALPPEIGRLSNLQTLGVSGNQLTALPPEIGRLAALQVLGVSGNQLMALPPEIGRLADLRWLNVSDNKLTALPPEIGCLSILQELYVSNNQLTALPPEIGRLSNLQELYVSNNQLTALPPEICRLSNLQKLSVEKNQLAALPPEIGRLSPTQYDVFLSHKQSSAGHLALALKLQLEQARPGLRVFLDVDDSRLELHQLENIIDASASVVLIISQDVLASQYVLGEVRHAARAGKNIVLLHDEKSCRFPAPGEIPSDLRLVFARVAIPCCAEAAFRRVSLRLLLEACEEGARR